MSTEPPKTTEIPKEFINAVVQNGLKAPTPEFVQKLSGDFKMEQTAIYQFIIGFQDKIRYMSPFPNIRPTLIASSPSTTQLIPVVKTVSEESKPKKPKVEGKTDKPKKSEEIKEPKHDGPPMIKIPKKSVKSEFDKKLESVVSMEGGLANETEVVNFISLMKSFPTNASLLLDVLLKSKPIALKKFISLDGLTKLKEWIVEPDLVSHLKKIIEVSILKLLILRCCVCCR
jgi:hypothetical protein